MDVFFAIARQTATRPCITPVLFPAVSLTGCVVSIGCEFKKKIIRKVKKVTTSILMHKMQLRWMQKKDTSCKSVALKLP